MKKLLFSFLLITTAVSAAKAANIALVYESEANVLKGVSFLGSVVGDGLVIPADRLPSTKSVLLAAPVGGRLYTTTLVRMDLQLNAAFLKFANPVTSPQVQDAHQQHSAALQAFLPAGVQNTTAVTPSTTPVLYSAPIDSPFGIKINGEPAGSDPIVLKKRLKKSKFKLEVVSLSTAPIWNVEVVLTSEPKLKFWKQGRKQGLNDVPLSKFEYSQQVMFNRLSQGKSFEVPIEAFFIEGEDYVFTFKISSKALKMEQPVPIKFKSL